MLPFPGIHQGVWVFWSWATQSPCLMSYKKCWTSPQPGFRDCLRCVLGKEAQVQFSNIAVCRVPTWLFCLSGHIVCQMASVLFFWGLLWLYLELLGEVSVSQCSRSVMSDSLQLHELQYARPACPSPTPGVHSGSHLSSQWCHPAISSSVVPFSSCPQSLPASESFPMSQLFAWGGQSTGVSALASFLLKNTQDWSPLEWTRWISLQSKGLSRVFSIPQFKSIRSLVLSLLHSPSLTSIHDHWKNHSLD